MSRTLTYLVELKRGTKQSLEMCVAAGNTRDAVDHALKHYPAWTVARLIQGGNEVPLPSSEGS